VWWYIEREFKNSKKKNQERKITYSTRKISLEMLEESRCRVAFGLNNFNAFFE